MGRYFPNVDWTDPQQARAGAASGCLSILPPLVLMGLVCGALGYFVLDKGFWVSAGAGVGVLAALGIAAAFLRR